LGLEDIYQNPAENFDSFDIASGCEEYLQVGVVDAKYSVDRVIPQQKAVFGIAAVAVDAVEVAVAVVEQEVIYASW
jgi:hypothetical protein